MTTITDIQNYLTKAGFYSGACDGNLGPRSQAALKTALGAGPHTALDSASIAKAAAGLGCEPAAIEAVWSVEAAGAGFQNGFPKILFEGHIFSALTNHVYDASHPDISYPHYDPSKYPATQDGRYAQLIAAVALNPDAAFQAASYGAFQILGENYRMCGFASPFEFVMAMTTTEGAQLLAFLAFVKARHLDGDLRTRNWAAFALGYNGTAYRSNHYDTKLAAAFARG